MTEGEKARLVAWSTELRSVHVRLRRALEVSREALASQDPVGTPDRDLLLFCHGLCTALRGHHRGQDRHLFPAIAAARPDLADTLRLLQQDHSMIEHLFTGLQAAVERRDPPEVLGRHLDGIGAIMENHFRFEERRLLAVLEALALDADPRDALGPL